MSEKPRVEPHIPANHRGDDIDTIGSFACECSKDLADRPLDALDAMCWAIDRLFADAQTRANKSKDEPVEEAYWKFFREDKKS